MLVMTGMSGFSSRRDATGLGWRSACGIVAVGAGSELGAQPRYHRPCTAQRARRGAERARWQRVLVVDCRRAARWSAGLVGIFVPLLPTAPFVLLAAFCFSRGSAALRALAARTSALRAPWCATGGATACGAVARQAAGHRDDGRSARCAPRSRCRARRGAGCRRWSAPRWRCGCGGCRRAPERRLNRRRTARAAGVATRQAGVGRQI